MEQWNLNSYVRIGGCSLELSSFRSDNAYYMQGSAFELKTPHLFTLKVNFYALGYFTKKEEEEFVAFEKIRQVEDRWNS